MERRVIGIETEFGCLVRDDEVGTPETIVHLVRDHCFYEKKWGVIDLHARDYSFEPARSGGFLLNGGRLYVDAVGDHEEYATAECSSILDVCRHHKAGQWLLQSFLDDLGLTDAVSFHNNSVDHFGGHTFGCHENYLVSMADEEFFRASLRGLIPFLVTRQIFAGVGRVGGHRLNFSSLENSIMTISDHDVDYQWISNFYGVELDNSVDFQLSQRADHIIRTIASRVRFNRAIINPKWDSYYQNATYNRLHILFGESNMSDYATALKVGTTSAVLCLLEDGLIGRDVEIQDPLEALRSISRDGSYRWLVTLTDGTTISAIDLQRRYLSAAKKRLTGVDEQTDWVLANWESTLDQLERDPMVLADRLDWVAKKKLFTEFVASEGVSWSDDILQSLDIEYHNINRNQSLFHALEQSGEMVRLVSDFEIAKAMSTPPVGTRAEGRANVVRRLIAAKSREYVVDWDVVYAGKGRQLEFGDPLHTYADETHRMLAGLPE
jgi:proteasome accessory factor A